MWRFAARPGTARRRLFGARLALTLRHRGVRELATRDLEDFTDFGFTRVWDPISGSL